MRKLSARFGGLTGSTVKTWTLLGPALLALASMSADGQMLLLEPPAVSAAPIITPPPPAIQVPPGAVVGVIMRVDSDASGQLNVVTLTRTIPIAPGHDVRGAVELPEAYLKAVRAKLATLRFTPGGATYRYFVFDPTQPERIDLGPDPETQN